MTRLKPEETIGIRKLRPGETIGIIGGGQLGRMLAMAAARLGFKTVILDPVADCPAAQSANAQIVAAYDDVGGLEKLAQSSAVVTYEFENIPVAAIEALVQHVPVAPPPRALAVAQDRVLEKAFLNQCAIPTAPWWPVDDVEMLLHALRASGGKGILKTRRLGYDGKGQVRCESLEAQQAQAAWAAIGQQAAIFEGFVDFECEISVIAARGEGGEVVFFDLPENRHDGGILRRSTLPARISEATAQTARQHVATLLTALDYVGVIGVEFFVLPDGQLLANEFAPRVHNSGHWTEAVCTISQFEQHIRAISGLLLVTPLRYGNCVMENLIGDDMARLDALLQEPDVLIHLYGKGEERSGRKMGHFTRILP